MSCWNGIVSKSWTKRKAKKFDNDIREIWLANEDEIVYDKDADGKEIPGTARTETVMHLDHKESITEIIDSQLEDSKLSTLVAKFNITGDTSLFNQHDIIPPEIAGAFAEMPMDPNDAADYIKTQKKVIQESTGLQTFTLKQLEDFVNANKGQAKQETQKEPTVENKPEPKKEEKPKEEPKTETTTTEKGGAK